MIDAPANYDTINALGAKCPLYTVYISQMPNLLVGAWTLIEASGQRADYTGRNELTPVNAPGTSAGKTQATALQLTAASSQYLRASVYDNSNLIMRDESFTIAAWVYLDSKGANRTIASHAANDVSTNNSWILRYETGVDRFTFTIGYTDTTIAAVSATTLGSPAINTWYLVIAAFNRGDTTANIQINAGTVDRTSAPSPAAAAALHLQGSLTDFRIGATYSSGITDFWNGRIEQVHLWRRLLTAAEALSLWNAGTGAPFTVVTDPAPFIYSTASNVANNSMGTFLLDADQLTYQTFIDKSAAPLTTLSFDLNDAGSAISSMVAGGVLGYKVRLYAGFYDLAFADFTQLFGGRITEIAQNGPKYRFTCRGYLTYGQDKIIFKSVATTLLLTVNETDTTFTVLDASAFPDAASVPQSLRRLILVDTEMCEYRGRSQGSGFSTSAWNLTSVVRSARVGYPVPPFYGGPAIHQVNHIVRHFPKAGNLVPETSQATQNWMHPMRLAQDALNNVGNEGLGESMIPLQQSLWQAAEAALGPALQFRYIHTDGINGKSLLESIMRDVGGYLVELGNGNLGPKLYPFATTLHAAWKLEEASGGRVDKMHVDRSRNYDLTPASDASPPVLPSNVAGKIGNGIQLTQTNAQYLWRPCGGLQPASSDFSIAVWVYIDSKGANRIIASQWDDATLADQAWILWYNTGTDRFRFTTSNGVTTSTLDASSFGSPSTGTWYLITASFTRSTLQMRISVNDGTVNTTTAAGYPVPTAEEFRIGAIANGSTTISHWDGRIDELGLWYDHVLTAAEITWLYNGGTGRAIEDFPTQFPAFTPASVDSITDSHVLDRPRWLRNGELAVNHVIYHYDYLPDTDEYTSIFEYANYSLIYAMGKDLPLHIYSKGIRSRMFLAISGSPPTGPFAWFDATERFLMNRAEAYIQRFGREAPVIGATTLYSKHLIEIGNDANVTFDQVVNLTSGSRSLSNADVEVSLMRHRYRGAQVDFEFSKYP